MADLPYLAQRLYNRPLMVTPRYAETVSSVLAARMGVAPVLAASEIETPTRRPYSASLTEGVLTLPIVGGLYHRGTSVDAASGAESYTNLQNQIVEAVNAKEVKGILLDIDSPGGEAAGCFEFCAMLAELAQEKPIWAIANACCCSAAYAIAASANRVFATPSADVGSIGVVVMHTDLSKALEKKGVHVTFIHAGARKVAGNAYEPLPDDVRIEIQQAVDESYQRFIEHVATRRPAMSADDIRATDARFYGADKALSIGLVDAVAPYEAVRRELAQEVAPKPVLYASPEGKPITITR